MLQSKALLKKAGQSESKDLAQKAKKAKKAKKARKQFLTASKKHVKIDLPTKYSEMLQTQ